MRALARRDAIQRFMEELAAEARADDALLRAIPRLKESLTQRRGLVDAVRAREYFSRIEPELYRYPAIDPPAFRRAVVETFS